MKEDTGITKLDEFRRKMSELEKAKREADRVRQEAIAELLQRRKEITRQLRQLGYEGGVEAERSSLPDAPTGAQVVSLFPDGPSIAKRRRLVVRNGDDRHCPVCEIAGHDLRAHRGQTLKRPFSPDELRTRGLVAR
jgi:hypothetical protein